MLLQEHHVCLKKETQDGLQERAVDAISAEQTRLTEPCPKA